MISTKTQHFAQATGRFSYLPLQRSIYALSRSLVELFSSFSQIESTWAGCESHRKKKCSLNDIHLLLTYTIHAQRDASGDTIIHIASSHIRNSSWQQQKDTHRQRTDQMDRECTQRTFHMSWNVGSPWISTQDARNQRSSRKKGKRKRERDWIKKNAMYECVSWLASNKATRKKRQRQKYVNAQNLSTMWWEKCFSFSAPRSFLFRLCVNKRCALGHNSENCVHDAIVLD